MNRGGFTDGRTGNTGEKKIDIPVVDNTESRARLIARIESVTSSVIQQICSGRLPQISSSLSHNHTATDTQMSLQDDPSNSNLESPSLEEAEEIEEANGPITKKSSTDFAKKGSKDKFALTMTVMATAHHLLLTNTTITRRSLYYDLKNKKTLSLVPEQRYVDQAVNHVANLLNCAPWELSECLSCKRILEIYIPYYLPLFNPRISLHLPRIH